MDIEVDESGAVTIEPEKPAETVDTAVEVAQVIVETAKDIAAEQEIAQEVKYELQDLFYKVDEYFNAMNQKLDLVLEGLLLMNSTQAETAIAVEEVVEAVEEATETAEESAEEMIEEFEAIPEETAQVLEEEPEERGKKKRRWI